ncbi:LysR family transcriptional regulator [Pseudomonas sp. BN411]|uniref:LysR family transcriptional regulator n=1 Tax=Pseudomonas sp. BN411 TaxID=2567887 RepID=UPI002453AB27|nr:LysR family transcriptional regulator [Pseudomonas sp. BN411]MDH4564225.1 LysR family transcriptional regulator [Pseudomonas sp. BN411]
MNWDDLRFFLDLARTGRLTASARRLGVEHTTVARKIQALETSLGAQLFVRSQTGYALTERGRRILESAEDMEIAYGHITSSIDEDVDVAGLVRIGCNEAYGTQIIPRHVAEIMAKYPELRVEVLALPRAIPLPRNEADIVISIDRPERGPYIASKLADYELGVYASPGYLSMHSSINTVDDLAGHDFIDYVSEMVLAKNVPKPADYAAPGRIKYRSTSILGQKAAAESGLGIVILPIYVAAQSLGLVRVLPGEVVLHKSYWITMHSSLRNVSRFRTVWNQLREMAESELGQASALALALQKNTPGTD